MTDFIMTELQFIDSQIQLPLLILPVRTVIVPTKRGNILISPGSKLSLNQLDMIDNVSDIIAPSLWHCGGISLAHNSFPNARVWGPPDVTLHKPEIPWTNQLTPAQWDLTDELVLLPIAGMPKVQECVFIHSKTQTLIVADLAFNLLKPKGFGAWLILKIFGTYNQFGISRLFLKAVKDQAAFVESVGKILIHDFDRIVMSHGDAIQSNGKKILTKALQKRGII